MARKCNQTPHYRPRTDSLRVHKGKGLRMSIGGTAGVPAACPPPRCASMTLSQHSAWGDDHRQIMAKQYDPV